MNELWETRRCDHISDFTDVRKNVEEYAGRYDKNSLERVLKAEQEQKDEEIMQRAMAHYRTWHQKQLVSALSWKQYLYYETNPDRVLAVVGIGGALMGPGRGLAKWMKMRNRAQQRPVSSSPASAEKRPPTE